MTEGLLESMQMISKTNWRPNIFLSELACVCVCVCVIDTMFLEIPVSKEEFPVSRGFSGNHLPFVGFSFSPTMRSQVCKVCFTKP